MLNREVHTSLRGRGMETVIGPFSFREFLRHRGEEPARTPLRLAPGARSRIEQLFLEYLEGGGFPEAQGLPVAARVDLLQGYVDAVLFRDVLERHNFPSGRLTLVDAPLFAESGPGLERASSPSGPRLAGAGGWQKHLARHAGIPGGRFPGPPRQFGYRLGASEELQPSQSLTGGHRPDRRLRSFR
jgi:hypothetical protein